jgi:hypothetical protein
MKKHKIFFFFLLITGLTSILASAQTQMKIESLSGPVLPSEINAFKTYMKSLKEPGPDNTGNNFVYGSCGANTESLGVMYEISRDPEILDMMIQYADHMLAGRNNPVSGRIIWTGKRELCWPNKKADTPGALYSATENGDVIAHIAYCAKLIIQNKSVWNHKVTIGDPHQFGKTYIERARTYIKECDQTINSFILPYLVKEGTHQFIFPVSEKYGIDARSAKSLGKPVPWNQQAMLGGGFQRLAECLELLGEEPEKVKLYDTIVRVYVTSFIKSLVRYQVDGHDCYKWSYSADDPVINYIEDAGHGGYDIWGVFRAFERNQYPVSKEVMQTLANTVQYAMYKGNGTFAWRVDGSDGKGMRKYLGSTWIYLSQESPALYPIIANACLQNAKTDPGTAARILWLKNQRYHSKK